MKHYMPETASERGLGMCPNKQKNQKFPERNFLILV